MHISTYCQATMPLIPACNSSCSKLSPFRRPNASLDAQRAFLVSR